MRAVPALRSFVRVGDADVLASRPAVHHVAGLLPRAPEVRLETGPGRHLGVLAGHAAGDTAWRWLDRFLTAATLPDERLGALLPSAA